MISFFNGRHLPALCRGMPGGYSRTVPDLYGWQEDRPPDAGSELHRTSGNFPRCRRLHRAGRNHSFRGLQCLIGQRYAVLRRMEQPPIRHFCIIKCMNRRQRPPCPARRMPLSQSPGPIPSPGITVILQFIIKYLPCFKRLLFIISDSVLFCNLLTKKNRYSPYSNLEFIL